MAALPANSSPASAKHLFSSFHGNVVEGLAAYYYLATNTLEQTHVAMGSAAAQNTIARSGQAEDSRLQDDLPLAATAHCPGIHW
jgi:hypothetical protein